MRAANQPVMCVPAACSINGWLGKGILPGLEGSVCPYPCWPYGLIQDTWKDWGKGRAEGAKKQRRAAEVREGEREGKRERGTERDVRERRREACTAICHT